jgi:hypothetical protein
MQAPGKTLFILASVIFGGYILFVLYGSLSLQSLQFYEYEKLKVELARLKEVVIELETELEELRPLKANSGATFSNPNKSSTSLKNSNGKKRSDLINNEGSDKNHLSHVVMFGQEADIVTSGYGYSHRREKIVKRHQRHIADSNKTFSSNSSKDLLFFDLRNISNATIILRNTSTTPNNTLEIFQTHNNLTKILIEGAKSYNSLAKSNKLFYIYPLEEEYWWRWPDPGTDCAETGYLG